MSSANGQISDRGVRASIITVNYNGGEAILECLESVEQQIEGACGRPGVGQVADPVGVEVLVVDNASTDGSPDSIKALFPEVQLIQARANLGYGAGNNLGVRHARGEYVVFLNPDTVVSEGWLDALIEHLEGSERTKCLGAKAAQAGSLRYMDSPDSQRQAVGAGPKAKRGGNSGKKDSVEQPVGLVTSKVLMADDPATINTCGNSVHVTGITLCRGLGEPQETMDRMEEVGAASGAAFAMRRDVFEEIGGFDEDMFLYMEDTDLSLRARLAGYCCWYVPESVVLHRYALKLTPMKVFYQERNRYLMLLKNLRWPTLVVLSPAFFCAEVIAWAFVALKDRSNAGNKIRAYGWVWQNWKSILHKRAMVQAVRRVPDRVIVRSMSIRLDFGQATTPVVAALAHVVFDPLFALFKLAALAIVWW